jgi:transaldolase
MQVKEEISNIVNTLPEDFLNELLQYLKKLEKTSQDKRKLSLHLNTILIEDKEVLTKLAR